jgi:small subunit ribosomal protein S17
MKNKKGIGIDVKVPSKACEDKNCPFHSNIKLRGRIFLGKIVSKDTHRTAKLEWSRIHPIPKYERFEYRKSGIMAHKPMCLEINIGDTVRAVECRPISKTKKFVIIDKIK